MVRRLSQNKILPLEISIYKETFSEACKFSLHATLCHRGAGNWCDSFSIAGLEVQAQEQEFKVVIKKKKKESFDEG